MRIYTEGIYLKTQEEDRYPQGEERDLRRNQTVDTLSSKFQPPEMWEKSYLNHSIHGALLHLPLQNLDMLDY